MHSIVAVLCDALTPLSDEERSRALVGIVVSLGIELPADIKTGPLWELLDEFGKNLRPEQVQLMSDALDMGQKIMLTEILNCAFGLNLLKRYRQ